MTAVKAVLDIYKKGDLEGAANVNVLTCSRLDGLVDGTGGLRYHASIPLYAGEKKLGVMNVASPQWRGLSPEDLQLLSTIGDLLAIAVERASLFDRSARLGAVEALAILLELFFLFDKAALGFCELRLEELAGAVGLRLSIFRVLVYVE